MEVSFDDFGLSHSLLHVLKELKYEKPTEIQSMVIPRAMSGENILGASQTGTGKTAAFMLPVLSALLNNPTERALVMAPTRELAAQIAMFARKLLVNKHSGKSGIFITLLIGGESIVRQFVQLERKPAPRLIIGTPGRVYDHIRRGKLFLGDVGLFVLDEIDRMLDLGFAEQVQAIKQHMVGVKQTMMFSATMPPNIVELSKDYMRDPTIVKVAERSMPVANIKQEVLHVASCGNKYDELLRELDKRSGSIIIFVKTKLGASSLTDKLVLGSHNAGCIHGDLKQAKRDSVIRGFRNKKYRIMVATDVASRGLDIPHIEHVINYDIPQCADDYIHRIGRTARAGALGSAIVFVAPADKRRWNEISNVASGKKPSAPLRPNPPSSVRKKRDSNNSFNSRRVRCRSK